MLILIDESGDPGFKPSSSPFLLISMIRFDDLKEAERAAAAIKSLQERARVYPEFKFSDCSAERRDAFFQAITPFDFKIRSIIFEKAITYSPELQRYPKKLYNYGLKMLLRYDNGIISNSVIKIDGSGSRDFKLASSAYLRKSMPDGKIKDIKFRDSRKDVLLQLADMVVSAMARPLNSAKKPHPYRWKRFIQDKIEDEWFFG